MALRFQKRIKVAPGVRVNLSLGGISTSLGPKGASLTVSKNGVHGNAGIPGTGLSARKKLSGWGKTAAKSQAEPATKDGFTYRQAFKFVIYFAAFMTVVLIVAIAIR